MTQKSDSMEFVSEGNLEPKINLEDLRQIIAVIKEIADRLVATNSSERLKQVSSALSNFKVKVGFIGLTSSGKSTTVNALLGQNFLPMSEQRQSVCPICIQHDPNPKSLGELSGRIKSDHKLKHLVSGVVSIRKTIEELNCYDHQRGKTQYAELVLRVPVIFLTKQKSLKINYVIYDTPGVSEKQGSVAATRAREALEGSAAIVLVVSPDTVDIANLSDFIEEIKEAHPNILEDQSRILVLINKYDKCYSANKTVKTFTWEPETFRERIAKQIGIPARQVQCFSAESALTSRIWKQDPSTVDRWMYMMTCAYLHSTPEGKDISSLEEYTEENVKKLIDVYERFSRICNVEDALCEKLFTDDLAILLKSTLDDCCCEIDKMTATLSEKIKDQQNEVDKLESLIQQIENILKNYKRIIASLLHEMQQNYENWLKPNALNLESAIVAEATKRMSNLRGEFDVRDELVQRISIAHNEVLAFGKERIKNQLKNGLTEIKIKLGECSKRLLDKFKEDVTKANLSDYLDLERIDLRELLECFSSVQVQQPIVEDFDVINEETLTLSRTVTRQKNESRSKSVTSFFLIFPISNEIPYNEVVDYNVTTYMVNAEGLTTAVEEFATKSATYVSDSLENILEEQTSKLRKTLLSKLQELSDLTLQNCLKSQLEEKIRLLENFEKTVKHLESIREELSNAIQQQLSQQEMSSDSPLRGTTRKRGRPRSGIAKEDKEGHPSPISRPRLGQ